MYKISINSRQSVWPNYDMGVNGFKSLSVSFFININYERGKYFFYQNACDLGLQSSIMIKEKPLVMSKAIEIMIIDQMMINR